MSEAPDAGRVTIGLGPTPRQLVHAFIWVVLGLVVSAVFLVATLTSAQPSSGSIAIGATIAVLSLLSGFLEYRNLPGVTLTVDAERVRVVPRRGAPVEVPRAEVRELVVDLVTPSLRKWRVLGPRTVEEEPGWWLAVHATDGTRTTRRFAVGMSDDRFAAIRDALRRFGYPLGTAF